MKIYIFDMDFLYKISFEEQNYISMILIIKDTKIVKFSVINLGWDTLVCFHGSIYFTKSKSVFMKTQFEAIFCVQGSVRAPNTCFSIPPCFNINVSVSTTLIVVT